MLLPQAFTLAPNLTILLAALMMMLAGFSLFASIDRTRENLLGRRIALVRPAARAAAEEATLEGYLVRLPVRGLSEPAQREVMRRLSRLGISGQRTLFFFTLARAVIAVALALLIFVWSRHIPAFQANALLPVAVAAMAAIAGWFVPLLLVNYGVNQRTKAVRSGLPDALELLVVCVEAGLSLEDGLDRVVTELARSQPALADELALTLADLKILPSRDQALANLALRVNIPTVRSIVSTLAQTLRYGTPLAQSLRVVAAEMRNDYLIELEEKANKLPAYLTLPVIVFLMPTIFLIVGGPAALKLLDAFHRF